MLTTSELASALGLANSTILNMHKAGKIPAYMLDNGKGDLRFDLEEVKAVLRANSEASVKK